MAKLKIGWMHKVLHLLLSFVGVRGFTIETQYYSCGNGTKDAYITGTWNSVVGKLKGIINGPELPVVHKLGGEIPSGAQGVYNNASYWSTNDETWSVEGLKVLLFAQKIDGKADPTKSDANSLARTSTVAARTTTENGSDKAEVPYISIIWVDYEDVEPGDPSGISLSRVLLHESIHALGFDPVTLVNRGLVDQADFDVHYMGSQGIAEYQELLGGDSAVGYVNLDRSSVSHWSEHDFDNELMTPEIEINRDMPLSKLTLGALKDLGYDVDFGAADTYSLPNADGGGTSISTLGSDSVTRPTPTPSPTISKPTHRPTHKPSPSPEPAIATASPTLAPTLSPTLSEPAEKSPTESPTKPSSGASHTDTSSSQHTQNTDSSSTSSHNQQRSLRKQIVKDDDGSVHVTAFGGHAWMQDFVDAILHRQPLGWPWLTI